MNINPKRGGNRDEPTMTMRTIRMCVAVTAVLALALVAGATESPPPAPPVDIEQLSGKPAPGGGVWKRMDLVIEWGFRKGTEGLPFDGSVEITQMGHIGKAAPLAEGAAVMAADRSWKSSPRDNARRGIRVPVLYSPAALGPNRTIVTVRTSAGSFSFLPLDLEGGPILAPEYGFFVATADSKTAAAAFQKELAAKQLKTNRQRVREMPEQSWEAAVRALHGDITIPPQPMPQIEPAMSVAVPDEYLTGMWRDGAWGIIKYCPRIRRTDVRNAPMAHTFMNQFPKVCRMVPDRKDPSGMYIVGCNPFSPIAAETDRILWALEHTGMHEVARDGISLWLENQQPDGCLSLGPRITNDGVHEFGVFHVLWNVVEHYRFTGDQAWLFHQLPRLKLAAKWIIDRRKTTMRETLTPQELEGIKLGTVSPFGLQPRISCGDGDSTGRRYWWWNDAWAYESLRSIADVIGDVDPRAAAEYAAECESYRKDILKVLNECLALSPVIKVRDGTYRSFHPPGFQDRGPLARSLPPGANLFSHCGPFSNDIVGSGAPIESWLRSGLLPADDPRIDGHFEVLEDHHLADNPWHRKRSKDYDPEKDWFAKAGWGYQSGWERMPDYYLLTDDVPNFLRSWLNHCAVDINFKNWSFNEHTTFAPNDKSHGRAVFLSNFRNMLVMEIRDALWLVRATPRAWLEQGKKISVKDAPTYFGTVAYEIISDVAQGKINATVEMPSRKAPEKVVLRFRHPKTAPIKSVTVNGKPWTEFNKDKETIELKGLSGKVTLTAQY